MQIVIKSGEAQKQELLLKSIPGDTVLYWFYNGDAIPEADAYFDLLYEEEGAAFSAITDKPVFVNAVLAVSDELPGNFVRINAWKGFLNRDILEIAGKEAALASAACVLDTLQWKYQPAPDTPGMIAARIIAMIVNEAYFGLGEDLSSKNGIDTAMKLGTNYPYGPFEWSERIGLQKIYALLTRLHTAETRYEIAPALLQDLNKQD